MYTREEAEGKRLRHPFDTITGAALTTQARRASRRVWARRPRVHARLTCPDLSCCCSPWHLRWCAEGIGINRLTQNFAQAQVDGAFKGTDQEAVEMVRQALRAEALPSLAACSTPVHASVAQACASSLAPPC